MCLFASWALNGFFGIYLFNFFCVVCSAQGSLFDGTVPKTEQVLEVQSGQTTETAHLQHVLETETHFWCSLPEIRSDDLPDPLMNAKLTFSCIF